MAHGTGTSSDMEKGKAPMDLCRVSRPGGEAEDRCDGEAANTVSLNPVDEIVTGRVTVDEAMQKYCSTLF